MLNSSYMVTVHNGALIRNFYSALFILNLLLFTHSSAASRSFSGTTENIPVIRLRVTLDGPNHRVYGQAEIKLPEDKQVWIQTGAVNIDQITLAGDRYRPAFEEGGFLIKAQGRNRSLRMRFSGTFPPTQDPSQSSSSNFITRDDVVLINNWYPRVRGPARYRLTATVPTSLQAISEADAVTLKSIKEGHEFTFDFPHPRTEVSLVVGSYTVTTDEHGGIQLATYFFPEDQGLAKGYLKKTKTYLDRYEALLGPYPFRRFAVVENRRPTGYGMATYTLIGQQVARLPFIVDTSLGHEILHSWFGNSVYLDPDDGNWSEGLTTYLSDHLYEAEKGKGWDYRHRVLVEYQSYVRGDKALPLRQFRGRSDRATQAIGYGKGAMFFHMLRQKIGEDAFFKALRLVSQEYRFRMAGWSELQAAFEQSSKKDLQVFFHQWLMRTDIPVLTLKRALASPLKGSRYRVTISVGQRNSKPYNLIVPVVVETSKKENRQDVLITGAARSVTLEVDGKPSAVVLDPDYSIMRKPGPKEYPPVLSRLLGTNSGIIVTPPSQQEEVYRPIIQAWRRRGFRVLTTAEVTSQDLAEASFLILGKPGESLKRLTGNIPVVEKDVLLTVRENPFNRQKVVAVLQGGNKSDISRVVSKLPHYGRYGTLRFQGGRVLEKKTPPFERGLRLAVQGKILGLAARDLATLNKIIKQVVSHKVIYVGETHDQYGHHLAQLELIKGLVRQGRKLAVGMEMFQRPYQPVIDQYLNGAIDERTFLAKTEYFKRWKFNYHLYRPIVEYCKEQGIPLVALNLPSKIVRKVAREGLEALTEEERRQIPEELDLAGDSYRKRLKVTFEQHPQSDIKNFETFFQSQVLWDETMAQSVHEYLKSHPDYQMVVLAGSGHVAFGEGIPSRVRRRGGYEQSIILNLHDENPTPEMADYFLYPAEATPPWTPKLGVHVQEKDGQISIIAVTPHGPAKTADLRAGDLLLAIDGQPLRTLADLRLALFFNKAKDTARLRIKRTHKLLPDEILEVTVGPFLPALSKGQEKFHSPHTEKDKKDLEVKGTSNDKKETSLGTNERPGGK